MDRALPRPTATGTGTINLAVLAALLVGAVLVVPWIGMNAGLTIQPALAWLDPDDTFVYLFVHHAVEGGLPLLLMAALVAGFGWTRAEFGLAWGRVGLGLRVTAAFAAFYLVLTFATDLLPYAIAGEPPGLAYWPTARNVIGTLAFQWLMVGLGEELLFRGLILGLLRRRFARLIQVGFGRFTLGVSVAAILTTILFSAEHTIFFSRSSFLDITFDPNWVQVGLTFALGIYYATLRERTGSLLGPILSHNISDGLYLSMTYLAVALTS